MYIYIYIKFCREISDCIFSFKYTCTLLGCQYEKRNMEFLFEFNTNRKVLGVLLN